MAVSNIRYRSNRCISDFDLWIQSRATLCRFYSELCSNFVLLRVGIFPSLSANFYSYTIVDACTFFAIAQKQNRCLVLRPLHLFGVRIFPAMALGALNAFDICLLSCEFKPVHFYT